MAHYWVAYWAVWWARIKHLTAQLIMAGALWRIDQSIEPQFIMGEVGIIIDVKAQYVFLFLLA